MIIHKEKFIEKVLIEFSGDSKMMKSIDIGKKNKENQDQLIERIIRTRAGSSKLKKIIDEFSKVTEVKKSEVKKAVEKKVAKKPEVKKAVEKKVAKKPEVKKVETNNDGVLLNCICFAETLFETDSMVQQALVRGIAAGENDTLIMIRILKARKGTAKVKKINAEFGFSINDKNVLLFNDKVYKSDASLYLAAKTKPKESKKLSDFNKPTEVQQPTVFKSSKTVDELKEEVYSNIIEGKKDTDAVSYISTELVDIFKNDTVVKKSFLVAEKNKEGLVGKILRALKIRKTSPRLIELTKKIKCDLDDLDDVVLATKGVIKSEKLANDDKNIVDNLNDIKYQLNDKSIALYIPNGEVFNISSKHKNFFKVRHAIESNDFKEAIRLISTVEAVKESVQKLKTFSSGKIKIEVKDKKLISIDEKNAETVINGRFADFLIELSMQDKMIENHLKFLTKMIENNMDETAIDGLFKFLKGARIPINTNGNIFAYKLITKDFKDVYTKKIDNSIGTTVSMDRKLVNANPNVTCSTGLHVCAHSYISSYSGEVLVICEIEPQDVVSVPVDYNFAKMRCCKYKVVEQVDRNTGDILAKRENCCYLS